MEAVVNIGSTVSKETAQNLQRLIEGIFRVGYRTHMDQATIQVALRVMAESLSVNGTTLTGCNINGDKTVNV